jgi:hypothetical protein
MILSLLSSKLKSSRIISKCLRTGYRKIAEKKLYFGVKRRPFGEEHKPIVLANEALRIKKSSIFWDVTPCILLKVRVSETHVTSIFMVEKQAGKMTSVKQIVSLTFFLGLLPTLKMEMIFSSETFADFKRTTRPYTPEEISLLNHQWG